MAVKIVVGCETNSQSVANNTSNVTVWVSAVWDGGSYNLLDKPGLLTIDGTHYQFTSPFNTSQTTSGSVRMFTKTLNIAHNADGTKTLVISAQYRSGVSSGTVTAGASVVLNRISRGSSLTTPASSGTLGTAMTFTINRQGSNAIYDYLVHHHKKTGSNSWTGGQIIYSWKATTSTKATATWTPPLSLANDVTDSTTILGQLTFYSNTTSSTIGVLVAKTYTLNLKIPDSVKPTLSALTLKYDAGHAAKYGGWVKGVTPVSYDVNTTIAYSSPIKSAKITIGDTYPATKVGENALIFDGVIPTAAGEITVTVSATDARGRTGTISETRTVLDYTQPVISKLTVLRCIEDENGNIIENDQGDRVQVKFTARASDLNSANTVKYTLRYKKTTDTEYTSIDLTQPSLDENNYHITDTAYDLIAANPYSIVDATRTFVADTGSSYDIELQVADDFYTTKRATVASTAFTLMHWKADGTGIGIGKIAEESNLFDIGLATRFNEPVYGNVMGLNRLPEIPANADFNDYMATGSYAVYKNANAETIANIPVARAGRLEVSSSTGEGIRVTEWSYIRQRFIPYNVDNATWERDITRNTSNVWTYGEWHRSSLTPDAAERMYSKETMREWLDLDGWIIGDDGQKVLWGGDLTSGMYMTDGHTATLTEKVSEQRNGIVLMFCYYNGTGDTNWGYQSFFVPKAMVALQNGKGYTFNLTNGKFGSVGTKYLYINDDRIVGHIDNNATGTAGSGITYANNKFVLRYVFGV